MRELSLHGVSVRFGGIQALGAVDLRVEAGRVMALAGPNGAGKSTLLKVILGLVRPEAGAMLVDGRPTRTDNAFKRTLGYLPEAVAFAESLTGRQVLRFFASARGVRRRRADEVLKRVGLGAAAKRTVRGYSRGMRQRLGLAVSIVSDPELLVLDEPTGGLDQEGLAVLWSVLAEWREAGRVVLVATHDFALMERRIDEMCVLRSGEVCAIGTPASLRDRAGLPVRVSFTLGDDEDRASQLVECVERSHMVSNLARQDGVLRAEVEPGDLLALVDLRADFPEAIRAIRVEEPGLDAVYERLLAERTEN